MVGLEKKLIQRKIWTFVRIFIRYKKKSFKLLVCEFKLNFSSDEVCFALTFCVWNDVGKRRECIRANVQTYFRVSLNIPWVIEFECMKDTLQFNISLELTSTNPKTYTSP